MKRRIKTLDDLRAAVVLRRAVIAPGCAIAGRRPLPAAWVYNMTAPQVHRLLEKGLFLYEKMKGGRK